MIEKKMLAIARSNKNEIAFVARDMMLIHQTLSDENMDVETTENGGPLEKAEKFLGDTVLSAFYLHAYSLATLSFNSMMADKNNNPNTDRTIVDYFAVEATKKLMEDK